ncbi:hypothetical protein [Neobacillus sp. PS3-40]|uniref:hypothetical protein n=1 Tax=Neobacillus sp. PS3-40 TaxID=3070679 RepID=UPI0027E1250E|nr:hypothetical protein [Neobacillus sp. PS3-40]WML44512.1 hypothetical protein RCG20_00930 [Neobacillus sp. PS3-40]
MADDLQQILYQVANAYLGLEKNRLTEFNSKKVSILFDQFLSDELSQIDDYYTGLESVLGDSGKLEALVQVRKKLKSIH